MTRVALPFLVIPDDCVEFDGWLIGRAGAPLARSEQVLEDWDYACNLDVKASVEIDFPRAAEALQIPEKQLVLVLQASAGTGPGSMPRRWFALGQQQLHSNATSCEVYGQLPGRLLSGRILLSLSISLASVGAGQTVLSPRHRGARLWGASTDVLIEGGGESRFPVEVVSFSVAFSGRPEELAPWYLHWRPHALTADFVGSVRLYVNADHDEVVQRFEAGDPAMLQAIMGDVISQMIATTLDQDELPDLGAMEQGSLGAQIRLWAESAFPDRPLESLRVLKREQPGSFRAAILAAAAVAEATE